MGDYLTDWNDDWLRRQNPDPDLTQRAWKLRDQGWSYTEIAARLGVTAVDVYRLTGQRAAFEQSPDPIGTIGHLMSTVNYELAHAVLHIKAALKTEGAERTFNIEHAHSHTESAVEHAEHLRVALARQYPEVKARIDEVSNAAKLDST